MRLFWMLLALAGVLQAELTLAPVFTDHMVLQREQVVPVWGRATPGLMVRVEFANDDQSVVTGIDGRWMVWLRPQAASADSQTLQVKTAGELLELTDVLVGDVWLCAGQSNMEWPLAKEMHAEVEVPHASHPMIRILNPGYAGKDAGSTAFSVEDLARLIPADFYRGAWAVCTPSSVPPVSAIGYYFARDLQAALQVPVGIIQLAVGGSPTEAWMRRELLASDPALHAITEGDWLTNPALEAWCRLRGRENLNRAMGTGSTATNPMVNGGPNHPFKPGFLWAAAIEPLAPFALRGVLWYQGESNSLSLDRVRQHELLLPKLVRDWRAHWKGGEIPFLYCQLSGIDAKPYHSEFWPEFRDSQRRLLDAIPNSGMVVTADVGDRTSVHPRDKQTIGIRLARLALAQTYQFDLESSGPQPQAAVVEGNEIVIRFTHAGNGLRASDGQALRGFEIVAADGQCIPVQGRIDGVTVVLACQEGGRPRHVRYGWQPFPEGNLSNGAALPASTFSLAVSGAK